MTHVFVCVAYCRTDRKEQVSGFLSAMDLCVYIYIQCNCVLSECVSMCGGYMEEAVFGLRLKCRTRVLLQERRPAEWRQRDFSPIRETRDTY